MWECYVSALSRQWQCVHCMFSGVRLEDLLLLCSADLLLCC